MNEKTKQLESLEKEKQSLDDLKQQVQSLTEQVEKAEVTIKDLKKEKGRLSALVKIGADSLEEQMKVAADLQNQLKLKNGSAVSTPCLTTNGGANGSSNLAGSSASLEPNSTNQINAPSVCKSWDATLFYYFLGAL